MKYVPGLVAGIIGWLIGALVVIIIYNQPKSQEELIKNFYDTQIAVGVSPHNFRKHMHDGTYLLVDVRSEEEYLESHIKWAINIPVYKAKGKSNYSDSERIVREFAALPKDKEIVTYCYSTACMSSRKVGKMLSDNGIYVKHLNIGRNEWKYFRTKWNHEHEWEAEKVEDFIESGPYVPLEETGEVDEWACRAGNSELDC